MSAIIRPKSEASFVLRSKPTCLFCNKPSFYEAVDGPSSSISVCSNNACWEKGKKLAHELRQENERLAS